MNKILFTTLAAAAFMVASSASSQTFPTTNAVVTTTNATPSVTLAWSAVSNPNISGYTVGWSTNAGAANGTYTNLIPVGPNTTATISNLTNPGSYFFAVQSTGAGVTSPWSQEVSATFFPSLPAPTGVVITGVH